jgi:hypothetical protein
VYVKNGQGYRRKVLVSESTRVYFTRRGGGSYGQSYSLRTLCQNCAAELDRKNSSFSWRIPVSLLVALVGFIFAVRSAVSSSGTTPSSFGSLMYAFCFFGGPGVLVFFLLGMFEDDNNQNKQISNTDSDDERNVEEIIRAQIADDTSLSSLLAAANAVDAKTVMFIQNKVIELISRSEIKMYTFENTNIKFLSIKEALFVLKNIDNWSEKAMDTKLYCLILPIKE